MTRKIISMFDAVYAERSPAFGNVPTKCVVDTENLLKRDASIVDLGCGDGRDSIYLLTKGHWVHAIDMSAQGIAALRRRAQAIGADLRLTTAVESVLTWHPEERSVDAIIGITILDHILMEEHGLLIRNIDFAIRPGGLVALEMHSERDPSFHDDNSTLSEFSGAIQSYAPNNYLISFFSKDWRIIYYSDRMEDDFDHGAPHRHGFVTIIAQKM